MAERELAQLKKGVPGFFRDISTEDLQMAVAVFLPELPSGLDGVKGAGQMIMLRQCALYVLLVRTVAPGKQDSLITWCDCEECRKYTAVFAHYGIDVPRVN